MAEPNGEQARLEKRAADLRRLCTEARDVIYLLRAHIARAGVDIGEDDRRVLEWLTKERDSER